MITFYLLGVLIAFVIICRHVIKTYSELTLSDVLIILAGTISSWLLVLIWILNWIYENGGKIVIYRFKK